MKGEKVQVGRLAMRQEGMSWNAYYAENDTMEDAIFLGSIQMAIVERSAEMKAKFMQLMREVIRSAFLQGSDAAPDWGGEVPAPEHERSGHS